MSWTGFGIITRLSYKTLTLPTELLTSYSLPYAGLPSPPGMGHFRSDLAAEPLRFWRVRSYLIIYRSEKRPIEIVRILHAARDVQAILGEKPAEPPPAPDL